MVGRGARAGGGTGEGLGGGVLGYLASAAAGSTARPLDEVRQWMGELKSAVAGPPESAGHALLDIVSTDCRSLVPVEAPAGKPVEQRA